MSKTLICIPTVPGNGALMDECIKSIKENTKKGTYDIIIGWNDFISFSRGVNFGIEYFLPRVEYDGFCIVTDDMEINDPHWLDELKMFAKNGPCVPHGYIGGDKDHLLMGVCYFPRTVIIHVGFFDERFLIGYWEDVDYSVRCVEKGYELNETPYSLCIHKDSKTMARLTTEQKAIKEMNKEKFKEKYKGQKWATKW